VLLSGATGPFVGTFPTRVSLLLVRRPIQGRKWGWLPADVVGTLVCSKSYESRALGAVPWALHCCFEHAD
jgi:hypothetical protein